MEDVPPVNTRNKTRSTFELPESSQNVNKLFSGNNSLSSNDSSISADLSDKEDDISSPLASRKLKRIEFEGGGKNMVSPKEPAKVKKKLTVKRSYSHH